MIDHTTGLLVVGPFGWPQVAVVHLLAALPLSWLIARWIACNRASDCVSSRWLLIFLTLGFSGIAVWLSLTWGARVGQGSFTSRLLARVAWCLMLQVPLLVPLVSRPPRSLLGLSGGTSTVLAIVVALALPAVYVHSLVTEQRRRADELIARSQWVRAQRVFASLDDLPANPLVERTIREFEAAVHQPLPTTAPPGAVIRHAGWLAALDRLDDARRLIQPLAITHADAALLLAAIDQAEERWADSDAGYRAVLARTEQMRPSDRRSLWRVQAFEGLADNARQQRDLVRAVAVFQEALSVLPEAEAYLHVQLGRQLLEARRPVAALAHLCRAAELEPHHYEAVVRPLIREIRQGTTGCFLGGGAFAGK